MQRTSRVQQRHRKDYWWRSNSIYIPHVSRCKDERGNAQHRWMDLTMSMKKMVNSLIQKPVLVEFSHGNDACQFPREGRKDVIRKFCKIRQEMRLTLESWSPRTSFRWSRARKYSEVWKVHRQPRRKIGRTCKSSHGCISCTKSSGPERMQKLPKRRTEARWQ